MAKVGVSDLRIIKKKYGEGMAKMCRRLFPTILEEEGVLSKILMDNFDTINDLYYDIVSRRLELSFKNYIYNLYYKTKGEVIEEGKILKSPEELLREAHYRLYCCETEEEIQKFRKYYASDEELCTFKGGRLETNYVYFAVRDGAMDLNRNDFTNTLREDDYGTSVISIQFTKDESHTLSIKNRYNHTVDNPDATFSNNLDNIIIGLTESFAQYKGMRQKIPNNRFELPYYVKANDGKYYKYNYGINNVYYCVNNIIIDNYEVIKYSADKYLIIDYFILDFYNKTISVYDDKIRDSFIKTIGKIKNISVIREDNNKRIDIIYKDGVAGILANNDNQIISYKNNYIENIYDNFFTYNKTIRGIELEMVKNIGSWFLDKNKMLESISLPNVGIIGDYFLRNNNKLKILSLPRADKLGNACLMYNESLEEVDMPNLEECGNYFLAYNKNISFKVKKK